MKTARRVLLIAALAASACSSPSSPAAPTSPAPPPAASPAPTGTLSGAWAGTGADPQGGEKMSWMLAQNGAALSGTADLAPLNAADGSCASCHKFKSGTVDGTVSASGVALKLVFPSGGDGVPTPMCTITFNAIASLGDG